MPEQEGQAPADLEALLALYREARGQAAEAEVELQHVEAELRPAPAALAEELARLKRGLRERQTTLIRALNDHFRPSLTGGWVLATQGVGRRGQGFVAAVLTAARAFTAFTADNDPHGEQDFGALTVEGMRVLFKIDYYDRSGAAGSKDPADPACTLRVLTLLLPEEY